MKIKPTTAYEDM